MGMLAGPIRRTITVHVTGAQMGDDAADMVSDTFVFHRLFGSNIVSEFDLAHDFLQFDKGMFGSRHRHSGVECRTRRSTRQRGD